MVKFILIFLFLAGFLFSLILGSTIFFHLKKFSLDEEKTTKKILKIFIIGCSFLLFLNIFFLILIFS